MRYELFLAVRYLKGLKASQPFASVIAAISVGGVALGVAALLVVLGVMSGFDADLESKIVGTHPHLTVQGEGGILQVEAVTAQILRLSQVVASAPFVQTQVLLRHGEEASGVILRGIDPEREPLVTDLAGRLSQGDWPLQPGELIVGSELARRWGLRPGDSITVIGGQKAAKFPVTFKREFTTGMYDYDMNLALAHLKTVQEIVGMPDRISGIGVRIREAMKAPEVKGELRRGLGFPYWVVTWMDLNRNLFAALKLEKVTMFVILTLIVLVACFNIVATLLIVVVEKTKEIGILKALGATSASVWRLFTWTGLIIGFLGTALGTAVGLGLCAALAKYQFIQLPPEIYYLDRLPVRLEGSDALAVALAAMALSCLSCLYPAWVAARLRPAEAIRYE